MHHHTLIKGVACATALCSLASGATAAEDLFADIAQGEPDLVTVSDGEIRGYSGGEVSSFFGIPYAAPPVGDLRWQPPAEPEPWNETLDAASFGNSCVQTQTYGVFATPSDTEDCLYLNVFTPTERRDEARPVMVWIHGGGLVNGRADDFDARKLVADGDVVVVSINYRLNLFGYFAHNDLDIDGGAFGNYGTMDQQAALRWVQDEIATFGGDPGNVTLFGESAGGLATLFNIVSPPAEGLFHKAILQSGVSAAPQTPLEEAKAYGEDVAQALGCAEVDDVAACMREQSVREIIEAGKFTGRAVRLVDGEILPGQMQTRLEEGDFHRVPILMGNNHDEWTWFISFGELASGEPLAAEDYESSFVSRFGEEAAAQIVEEYPLADFPSPSIAAATAGTAGNFVCPSKQVMESVADQVPLYVYEFMDDEAPFYFPKVSFPYGAAHTLELQYLFPRYHGAVGEPKPLNDAQQELADAMVGYWTNFAATGNPNGTELPEWPRWTSADPQIQLLDTGRITSTANTGIDRKCSFWTAL